MPEEVKPEPDYRLFWAQSTDPAVCGVWDRHPQHPRTPDLAPDQVPEVFVSGDKVVQVAATPVVLDALAKGRIREVNGADIPRTQPSQGNPAQPAVGGEAPGDVTKSGRR